MSTHQFGEIHPFLVLGQILPSITVPALPCPLVSYVVPVSFTSAPYPKPLDPGQDSRSPTDPSMLKAMMPSMCGPDPWTSDRSELPHQGYTEMDPNSMSGPPVTLQKPACHRPSVQFCQDLPTNNWLPRRLHDHSRTWTWIWTRTANTESHRDQEVGA
jgi:hypothetical protein